MPICQTNRVVPLRTLIRKPTGSPAASSTRQESAKRSAIAQYVYGVCTSSGGQARARPRIRRDSPRPSGRTAYDMVMGPLP